MPHIDPGQITEWISWSAVVLQFLAAAVNARSAFGRCRCHNITQRTRQSGPQLPASPSPQHASRRGLDTRPGVAPGGTPIRMYRHSPLRGLGLMASPLPASQETAVQDAESAENPRS
jgi:hypothetical protein